MGTDTQHRRKMIISLHTRCLGQMRDLRLEMWCRKVVKVTRVQGQNCGLLQDQLDPCWQVPALP